MFGRQPVQLQGEHFLEEGADLNPIPVDYRAEIAARVRERQDISATRMKRKWDTTNTIVCV